MSEKAFVVHESGTGSFQLKEALESGQSVKTITTIGTSALVITHDWFPNCGSLRLNSPNVKGKLHGGNTAETVNEKETSNEAIDIQKP